MREDVKVFRPFIIYHALILHIYHYFKTYKVVEMVKEPLAYNHNLSNSKQTIGSVSVRNVVMMISLFATSKHLCNTFYILDHSIITF